MHDWVDVGINSILMLIPIERCSRCGVGRQYQIYGEVLRWTKEQMETMGKPDGCLAIYGSKELVSMSSRPAGTMSVRDEEEV